MSLQTRLAALAQAIGGDVNALYEQAFPPIYTSLPSSPSLGQEICVWADPTDTAGFGGMLWRFRYEGTTPGWVFMGGCDLFKNIGNAGDAVQSTTNGAFVDLSTVGPSLPLAWRGDYIVEYGFMGRNNTLHGQCRATPVVSGVTGSTLAAAIANQAWIEAFGTSDFGRAHRIKRLNNIAGTIKLQYSVTTGTGDFIARDLKIRPIRIY